MKKNARRYFSLRFLKTLLRAVSPALFFSVFFLLIIGQQADAASGVTYHGRIVKPDGSSLSGTSVQFKVQIRSPGANNCLMYEEIQSLAVTDGIFALAVGDGSVTPTFYVGTLPQIFDNTQSFTFGGASGCTLTTTYNPSSGDGRNLQVYFREHVTDPWEPMPLTTVNFVPLALQSIQSEQVGKYTPASLLRVDNAGTPGAASAFTSAQFTELQNLIAGTSTQYTPETAGAGTEVKVISGSASSPVAGSFWLDSSSGSLKYFDGSTTKTLGVSSSSAGTVTSITTGTGLSGGTITTSGTISIAPGGVSSTELANNSVTSSKIVDGTIVSADLSPSISISTTGSITASGAITSASNIVGAGLSTGGSLSVAGNSTILGNEAVTGNVGANSISTRAIYLSNASGSTLSLSVPSVAFTNFGLIFPSQDGSNGQVLKTDGSGNLAWSNASAGSVTSITAGSGLSGGTITSTGTIAIQPNGVTSAMIQDGTISSADLSPSISISTTGSISASGAIASNAAITGASLSTPGSIVAGGAISSDVSVAAKQFNLMNSFGNIVSLKANPVSFTNFSLNLPSGDGSSGQMLTTNGSGSLYWASIPTGLSVTTAYVNGGNSFGGLATLGTNDNNKLQFKTNNTAQMTIDTNGNVGVGTSAPASPLSVVGAIAAGHNLFDVNNTTFVVDQWSDVGIGTAPAARLDVFTNNGAGSYAAKLYNNQPTGNGVLIKTANNSSSYVTLDVQGNNGARSDLFVRGDGYIGMGNSSPSASLDVTGNVKIGTSLSFAGSTSGTVGFKAPAISGNTLWTLPSTDGTASQVLQTNGSGTLSWTTVSSGLSASTAFVQGGNAFGAGASIGTKDAYALSIMTNNTPAIHIKSDGTVGIANTSPSSTYALDVGSRSHFQSGNSGGVTFPIYFENQNASNAGSGAGISLVGGGVSMSSMESTFEVSGQPQSSLYFVTHDSGGGSSSEKMRITSSGKVGIGTSAPAASLDVTGNVAIHGNMINNTGSTSYGLAFDAFNRPSITSTGGGLNPILTLDNTSVNAGAGNAIAFMHGPSPATGIEYAEIGDVVEATTSDASIYFSTRKTSATTERMRLTSSGNLGIGTSAPSASLDVTGSARIGTTLSFAGSTSGSVGFQAPAVAGNKLWTLPSTDGTSGQVLSTNGSGTLSWAASGGGGDFMKDGSVAMTGAFRTYSGTASAPSITFNGNTNTGIFQPSGSQISFATSGTERMNISNTGQVSIYSNTGGVFRGLSINNSNSSVGYGAGLDFGIGGTSEADIDYVVSASGGNTDFAFTTRTNNVLTEKMRISANGGVGIGISNPAASLDVSGSAQVGTSLSFAGSTSGTVGFKAPAVAGNKLWTLPSTDGTASQVLKTDGAGNLGWTTMSSGLSASTAFVNGGNAFGTGASLGTTDSKTLGFITNNTQRMTIDNTGYITTFGKFEATAGSAGVMYDILTVTNSSASVTSGADILFQNGAAGAGKLGFQADGSSFNADFILQTRSNNGLYEKMRIVGATGNVGIGTSTPAASLDVTGSVKVGTTLSFAGSSSGTVGFQAPAVAGNKLWTLPSNDGSSGQVLKTDGSGNLSWMSPVSSSTGFINGGNSFGAAATVGTNDAYTMGIKANGTTAIYIDTNGKVGVGQGASAPNAQLQVNGPIVGKAAVSNATTTIDFSTGNIQMTTLTCQGFTLTNLKDGGSYMLMIKNTTTNTCSFSAFTDTSSGPQMTVHYPAGHGATTSGKNTVYNFVVTGTDVWVMWSPGYN